MQDLALAGSGRPPHCLLCPPPVTDEVDQDLWLKNLLAFSLALLLSLLLSAATCGDC